MVTSWSRNKSTDQRKMSTLSVILAEVPATAGGNRDATRE
jgi:hypothetical protein